MQHTKLIWVEGVDQIGHLARVSNPKATLDDPTEKLIAFLIRNRHWSPFEMASMCVEINTTRDIGRQILRHRSFSFQEFSQRYAVVDTSSLNIREMRQKGTTNRQGSLDKSDRQDETVAYLAAKDIVQVYNDLIKRGVAPECARAVLPEGFTPTRMYMTGTIRSWIHYMQERCGENVQKEHRIIAWEIKSLLCEVAPLVYKAVFENE